MKYDYIRDILLNYLQNLKINKKSIKKISEKYDSLFTKLMNFSETDMLKSFIKESGESSFGNHLELIAIEAARRNPQYKHVIQIIDNKFDCSIIGYNEIITIYNIDFILITYENIAYIIQMKSGSRWSNNSAKTKLDEDFKIIKNYLLQYTTLKDVICINGIANNETNNILFQNAIVYSGQKFWEFISGEENYYNELENCIEKLKSENTFLNLKNQYNILKQSCYNNGTFEHFDYLAKII